MSTNDIYRVTAHIDVLGRGSTLRFHYKQTSVNPTDDTCDEILAAWILRIRPTLLAILSNQASISTVDAHRILPVGIPSRDVGSALVGGILGVPMPSNKALVLSMFQEGTGAKRNGRCYVPGIAQASTNGNIFTPGYISGVVKSLTDDMEENIDSGDPLDGDFQPQVVTNTALPLSLPNIHPVTSVVGRNTVYNQRRRTTQSSRVVT